MADDSFVGKEVTVQFEVTEKIAWKGTVLADDEKGITIRRPYRRRGLRDELIPRDAIRGVFHELEKGSSRRKPGTKVPTATEPDKIEDLDETEDLDEIEDLDNDGPDDGLPDTEWDEDE